MRIGISRVGVESLEEGKDMSAVSHLSKEVSRKVLTPLNLITSGFVMHKDIH